MSVTHFEIYGEEPAKLADFYRSVFGWQVEQMPGVNYWRIQTGSAEPKALHGGLTYRAIPDLNGWMLFVNVGSLDDTVTLVQKLGGSIVRPKTAVPRTAWVKRRDVRERHRTIEHRVRRLLHTHVCARHSPAHSQRPASRRDDGRDHGSVETLCRAGRASLQPWCADSRRGAGKPAAIQIMTDKRGEIA